MSADKDARLDEIEQRIRELDANYAHRETGWDEEHGDEYGQLLTEFMELTGTRWNS